MGVLLSPVPGGAAQQDTMTARGASTVVDAAGSDRPTWEIGPAAGAIVVDGRLDDAGWTDALVVPLAYEVRPAENAPAPVETRCRMAYDDRALYLGCVAHDPDPGAIRAYVVDRDGIDGHDRVVLTLDPFNDRRRAFQFGVSALGVQSDAILAQQGAGGPDDGPDDAPVDPAWDAIWSSAGRLTDDGYVVEAAVPFRALRFPATDGPSRWGIYLSRWWPRSDDVELRSGPWDRDDACVLCNAADLTGLAGIVPGANVQLTPTLTASRTDTRTDGAAGLTAGPGQQDVGLDAQWGVTSNLTLNLTANPDFSQVEADVAQLEVNQRFALFFPEKRPFFLEGADVFGTPVQAVFTRSIVDPVAGAKVTGKAGPHALGVLVARDGRTGLLFPGRDFSTSTTVDAPVTTSVARLRTDVGGTSTVGALVTAREGGGYSNRVGGVDAFYRPVAPLTLQAQYLRSRTRYTPEVARAFDQPSGAFGGDAVRVMADWASRDWLVSASGSHTGGGFRADAGFVTQSGRRAGTASVMRRWWGGADSWYTQFRVQAGTWQARDLQGARLNGGIWFGLHWFGPGQTFVGLWPNLFVTEAVGDRTYDGMNQLFFTVTTAPSGALRAGVSGDWGNVVDVAEARQARQLRVSPNVGLRMGRNVDVNLQHTFQRMDRDGGRVLTAHLSQVRAVYNVSPRSYVRAIVQYRQTERDPARFTDEVDARARSVFTQLLYSYKVNPQTVVFLGYSDDRDAFADAPGAMVPLTRRGRTFFLKLGYAFQP